MKKPARKDPVADSATVLSDARLRHVIGGHVGGASPSVPAPANQAVTSR